MIKFTLSVIVFLISQRTNNSSSILNEFENSRTNASIADKSGWQSYQTSYRDFHQMLHKRVSGEVGQQIAPAGGLHQVINEMC